MKRFLYIPLLFILLLNCKKDKIDSQPEEIMKPLVGKWYLAETGKSVNGLTVWTPFPGSEAVYLNFRFDGVLLDENGKASCCAPKIFTINNTRFQVIPRAAISYSADCSAVYCSSCPFYEIEVNGNEMFLTYCDSSRARYIRV